MHALSFETFKVHPGNEAAYQACLDAAHLRHGPGCPLILMGPGGVGKTHLLWAIVEEVRQHAVGVALAFVRAGEFPEKVRRLAKHPAPIQQGRPCLLLVDDTESFDDFRDELERVVELFLQHGHTVILASQVPVESLPRFSAWFHALLSNGRTLSMDPADATVEASPRPAVTTSKPTTPSNWPTASSLPESEDDVEWDDVPNLPLPGLMPQPDPIVQAELEELIEDRERLSSELESVLRNMETLRVSSDTQQKLSQDLSELRAQVARGKAERDELRDTMTAERDALRQALAAEKEARERAEAASASNRQSFEAERAEIEERAVRAATEAAELRRELSESRSKHGVLRRALTDTSSLDEVKLRYSETIRMLNEQLDNLREELRSTRQERTVLEHKVAQTADLPMEVERLRREADGLRTERANFKSVLDDTSVLDQLKARHEETVSMLRGQLDSLRMKMAEAREERDAVERTYEDRISQAAERTNTLRKELDDLSAERQQLYESLSDTRAFDELQESHAETARFASDQMDILRAEIRRLRGQHTALEKELADTLARARSDRESSEADLASLQAVRTRMESQLADTSALDELKVWHAQGAARASELIAAANTERDRAFAENERMRARMEEKTAQLTRLKTELEETLSDTSALDALRERHTEAVKALNTQRAESAAIRDERDTLRQECQRLQRQTGELDSMKVLLEQSLRVKVEEMAQFQSELQTLRREINASKAEAEASRAAQERLRERLAEKAALEGALAEAEAGREKLLEAHESRTREWEALRKEQANWDEERERLVGRLAQAGARTAELSSVQAELDATREDQTRLQEELQRCNAEIAVLQRERARTEKRQAELEILAASLPQVDEERRALRRELWDQAEQLTFVQAELAAVKDERERLLQRGTSMEKQVRELAEARRDLWRMGERLSSLQEERQTLEAGLADARVAIEAAQGLHAALAEACAERDETRQLAWSNAERLDILRSDMQSLLAEKSRLEHLLGLAEEWTGPAEDMISEQERLRLEIQRLAGSVEAAWRNAEEAERTTAQANALENSQREMENLRNEAQADIQALRETIGRLSAELADVEAETRIVGGDQGRLQELLQANEAMQNKLRETEEERNAIQEVLARLRAQMEAAQADRDTAQQEHDRLQSALRTQLEMEQTLRDAETARNHSLEEMTWLRDELKSCAAAVEESQANQDQISRLLEEKSGAAQALEAMQAECEVLRERAKAAYDEIARSREVMQAAVLEHARLQNLVDEKNAIEEQARAVEAERVRLMEDAAELGDRLDRLRAEIRAHEARQISLREVLAAKEATELRLAEACEAREKTRQERDELQDQAAKAEAEEAALKSGIEQLDAILALKSDMEGELNRVEIENDADRRLLHELASQVQDRLDQVHAGQAAFAYAGQETLSALEQLGASLRARAEGPVSGRILDLEKEVLQTPRHAGIRPAADR